MLAFNRNDATNPINLWHTVAYELACRCHACRDVVISKLKNGGFNLTNAIARDVFQELVVPPLWCLSKSLKDFPVDCFIVFVVSALDECGRLSNTSGALAARKEVMSSILLWAKLVLGFKLVVSSDPKVILSDYFQRTPTPGRDWHWRCTRTLINRRFLAFGPFNGHSGDANCVAFSPDSNRVASCSDNESIRFWELCTCKDGSAIDEETAIVHCHAKSSMVKGRGNKLFTDGCKRDEAGWVISEKGELLFWIPTITRLCDVRETRRLLEVDCEDVCWGDKWIGCYKL